jgi:hypothetical protein
MAGIVDHCVVHDYEEWLDIRPRDCYERELTQKNEAITALTAALLEEQAELRKLREALEKAEDLTDWQEAELRKWRELWADHEQQRGKFVFPYIPSEMKEERENRSLTLDEPENNEQKETKEQKA